MKRIIEIKIDNFKAYYRPFSICMAKGQNVLIYGENGSGKSSLYKAVRHFMRSSVDSTSSFDVNQFTGRNDGTIDIVYSDIDSTTNDIIQGTEATYRSSSNVGSSNNADFIKLGYRASGFLDYTQLLRVYLSNSSSPNLFKLVLDLIGNYIPTTGGITKTIKELYESIINKTTSSHHRSDNKYKSARRDFDDFKLAFQNLILNLNSELGGMMKKYFSDFNLQIQLNLISLKLYEQGKIKNTDIEGIIYLEVKQFGNQLLGYNDKLNEARLSAIAICLYLSSLKLISSSVDTKLLFLDDVFIGLDLGNRKPVLNIINNEFFEYQKFISTYDRSWFNQVKLILGDNSDWIYYELYEGVIKDAGGNMIANPLLLLSDTDFGKAYYYYSNQEHPDYPAAANYLRKAFEGLLNHSFISAAFRDKEIELRPAFNLTKIVEDCINFCVQINEKSLLGNLEILFLELQRILRPLLHPLSHYVPDVPIYRSELKEALTIYDNLQTELKIINNGNKFKVLDEKGHKIQLIVKGLNNWIMKYDLQLIDHLYIYLDTSSTKKISNCKCRVIHIFEKEIGKQPQNRDISSKYAIKNHLIYNSLEDCFNKLLQYIRVEEKKTDIIYQTLNTSFFFPDDIKSSNYIDLDTKINSVKF